MFLGRVVAPGEPLWTDEDRGWAMALLEYEADICSWCGQPRSQSMAAENEFRYESQALRCHGCKAVARGSEPFSKPDSDTRGLMIAVKLKGGSHG